MKLYADLPPRRFRQIAADLLMVAWVIACVLGARVVHSATMSLAAPGSALEDAGAGFQERMLGASERAAQVPLIQGHLVEPLQNVAGVGTEISAAGTTLVEAVERLALVSAWTTALAPIIVVGSVWLALRLWWIRRARAARSFLDAEGSADLLALRALARQPVGVLGRVSADPVGGWRREDPAVVRALVDLELADLGLLHRP